MSVLLACVPGCARAREAPRPATAPPSPAPVSLQPLAPADLWALYEHPAWSPDGSRLAFAEWWVAYDPEGKTSRSRARLLAVERGGSTPRVLWDSGEAPQFRRIDRIQWSSDGARLLFSEKVGPFDSDDIRTHTRVVTPLGEVEREIDSPSFVAWDWSPDGQWIAFTALQGPTGDLKAAPGLWIIRLDGREQQRVVPLEEGISWADSPAWSPDGKRIAFFFGEQGDPARRTLRVVDRAGNAQALWQQPPGDVPHRLGPAWSADGRRLFLALDHDLVTIPRERPESAQTHTAPGPIVAIAPSAGVFACFADGNLVLATLDGAAEHRITRDGPFTGKLAGPRLGAWEFERAFTAEADIARDRAVAVTADRTLYRFFPPFH